jgi:beta-glucosidase
MASLPTYPAVDACAGASVLSVFHTLAVPPFSLYLADENPEHPAHDIGSDLNAVTEWPASHPVLRLRTVQVNTQQDAKSVTWLGAGRFFARSAQPRSLMPLVSAHAALQFDVVIATPATPYRSRWSASSRAAPTSRMSTCRSACWHRRRFPPRLPT